MSDQDTTIFNNETQSTNTPAAEQTPAVQNVVADQAPKPVDIDAVFADQLAAIQNDQGTPKYSDVPTALHALKASQSHINTLEEENLRLKDASANGADMSQIMELLNSNNNSDGKTSDQQFSVEDIKGVALNALKEQQAENQALSNQQTVVTALETAFGEKANETFIAKANELGLGVQELNRLSALSPNAVLKYFETKDSNKFTTNSSGSVNTDALQTNTPATEVNANIMYGSSTEDVQNLWSSVKADVNRMNSEG